MSTCWPARWLGQPGTSSTSVVARRVSATLSTTSASRQARRRPPAPAGGRSAASVAVIPLLAPGVAVDVVAERLPEARLVVLHETEPADPLGRFPEVEVRDQQARRAAMLGLQRLAVVVGGHHALATDQILDRQVGGVTAIAVGNEIGRRRLVESRRLDQVVDRHALPCRPELAPLGDAMDIDGDLGLRQGLKLVPRPPASERSPVLQRQGPLLECRMRRRAGAQHREVVGDELAGRNPIAFGPNTAPAREPSGRRRHERCLRGPCIRRTWNPRLNIRVAPSASLYAQCQCFGCSFKAYPLTELLSYVKLAR